MARTNTRNQRVSTTGEAFMPDRRPPLEKLPPKLRKALTEWDELRVKTAEADRHYQHLLEEARDTEAAKADGAAAAAAIRAGKPVGPPEHAEKLAADRITAKRNSDAHHQATAAALAEIQTTRSALIASGKEQHLQAVAASRAELTRAAEQFAEKVETIVRETAIGDWLYLESNYQPRATTSLADLGFLDWLNSHGVSHSYAPILNVRDVLIAAATSAIDPEPNR